MGIKIYLFSSGDGNRSKVVYSARFRDVNELLLWEWRWDYDTRTHLVPLSSLSVNIQLFIYCFTPYFN